MKQCIDEYLQFQSGPDENPDLGFNQDHPSQNRI